jgi:hypothetical protein
MEVEKKLKFATEELKSLQKDREEGISKRKQGLPILPEKHLLKVKIFSKCGMK